MSLSVKSNLIVTHDCMAFLVSSHNYRPNEMPPTVRNIEAIVQKEWEILSLGLMTKWMQLVIESFEANTYQGGSTTNYYILIQPLSVELIVDYYSSPETRRILRPQVIIPSGHREHLVVQPITPHRKCTLIQSLSGGITLRTGLQTVGHRFVLLLHRKLQKLVNHLLHLFYHGQRNTMVLHLKEPPLLARGSNLLHYVTVAIPSRG